MEVLKVFNAAREKSGSDIHIVVYEVMSGAAEGTFLSIVPRKSLAEIWRRVRELADTGGFTLDNTLFAFEPSYSNASDEIAAADPNFWHVVKREKNVSSPSKAPKSKQR
jgi:hypothetical protein